MNKKKALLIWMLLLLSLSLGFSLVAADLSVSGITPGDIDWTGSSTIYEFSSKIVQIDFNGGGGSFINSINISTSGAILNSIERGPSCSISGSKINCNNDEAKIKVNITALEVVGDSSWPWSITVIDNESGLVAKTLSLTVQNDVLVPRVTVNSPSNYVVLQPSSVSFNLSALDSESGIKSAWLYYDYYTSASATSGILGSKELSCGANCLATMDLSPLSDKSNFGYFYNVSDNGGNVNQTPNYWIFLDTEAPIVTLITPANYFNISALSYNYGFTIKDNSFAADSKFNPQVVCGVYIDGVLKNSDTVTSNSTLSLSSSLAGLADGEHRWNVTCVDVAGWSTSSETRIFVLDTTPPEITLSSPANNSVIGPSYDISLIVSDSYSGVDVVLASIDGGANSALSLVAGKYVVDVGAWADGVHTLAIFSNDTLGNGKTAGFAFTMDAVAPTIELLTPANDSYYHTLFEVNATDVRSATVNCSLLIDGAVLLDSLTASGAILKLTPTLSDGSYTWAVRCQDEVGNVDTSAGWMVKVDTVAPVFTLGYPGNDTNYPLGVIEFNLTPESASDSCSVYIDNILYTGAAISYRNAVHEWKVSCTDLAGNLGWSKTLSFYQDNVTPVVSNVSSGSVDSSSAIVGWNVDEASSNIVYYGTNSLDLTATVNGTTRNTTPQITVAGLSAPMFYYYFGRSCDRWDHCINSTLENFTTAAVSSSSSSSGGGGGGGGSGRRPLATTEIVEDKVCAPNWHCNQWNICSDGVETRKCIDWNSCGKDNGPSESRSCGAIVSGNQKDDSSDLGESDLLTAGIAANARRGNGRWLTGLVVSAYSGVKNKAPEIALGLAVLSTLGILGILGYRSKVVPNSARAVRNYKVELRAAQSEKEYRERLEDIFRER